MTDYLTILAERHLGTARAIQPRVVSRFEPVEIAGTASVLSPLFPEPLGEEPSAGVAQDAITDRAPRPAPLRIRPNKLSRQSGGDEPEVHPGVPVRPAFEASGAPPKSVSDHEESHPAVPAPRQPRSLPRAVPRQDKIQRPNERPARRKPQGEHARGEMGSVGEALPAVAHVTSVQDDAPTFSHATPRRVPDLPLEHFAAPDDIALSPGASQRGHLIAQQPEATQRNPPGRRPAGRETERLPADPPAAHLHVGRAASGPPLVAPDSSPQTIQVTIGRIEVRAVAAQPPALPARRPRSPALSLEDYLRKRAADR